MINHRGTQKSTQKNDRLIQTDNSQQQTLIKPAEIHHSGKPGLRSKALGCVQGRVSIPQWEPGTVKRVLKNRTITLFKCFPVSSTKRERARAGLLYPPFLTAQSCLSSGGRVEEATSRPHSDSMTFSRCVCFLQPDVYVVWPIIT